MNFVSAVPETPKITAPYLKPRKLPPMGPKTPNPDEQLLQAKHGGTDLFICDVADAVLKDLIPQMEHAFYSLSQKAGNQHTPV
jgi:hypothetical protein